MERQPFFIDAATVESARRVIYLGLRPTNESWDRISVCQATYYMMKSTLHVLPGLGIRRPPVGGYVDLLSDIPDLENYDFSEQPDALLDTLKYLDQNEDLLPLAWAKEVESKQMPEWRDTHKAFALVDHAKRHRGLLEPPFIPFIAKVLNRDKQELHELHNYSKDIRVVTNWQNRAVEGEVLIVADAWMLDGMMRHIFHQYLAAREGYKLISHPFRNALQLDNKAYRPKLNKSFLFLSNFIVERALALGDRHIRVGSWLTDIKKVRRGLESKTTVLRQTDNSEEAIKFAVRAAEDLEIGLTAKAFERAVETLPLGEYRRLSELPDIKRLFPDLSGLTGVSLVLKIIDAFPTIVRLLGNRAHGRPDFSISNEYDVQDLLFGVIRSVFEDARREDFAPQLGLKGKRIDIVIPSERTVIEVKYVRDVNHARNLDDELKIDIESYHSHPSCKRLIAMIYDPNAFILDAWPLENGLSGRRTKCDRQFLVRVLVRR
jgi:DpnII restriction endonuclease